MKVSLLNYKNQLLEQMLKLLWSGWAQLGVAGYKPVGWKRVIDIEALILTTCFWGRYDQRLFDEMLSWLLAHERFVNIQRLQTIIKKETFHESGLLGPISRKLCQKNRTPKWRGIASKLERRHAVLLPEKLFLLPDNKPLPVVGAIDDDFAECGFLRLPFIDRQLSTDFATGVAATLQLQLRAFFGVCSRAEIMLAFFINNQASISDIAASSYYSWKSIQEALFEMSHSGIVSHPASKRERRYYLASENWTKLFIGKKTDYPEKFNWCKFFSAMEILWQKVSNSAFGSLSEQSMDIEIADMLHQHLQSLLTAADENWRVPSPATSCESFLATFSAFIITQLKQLE